MECFGTTDFDNNSRFFNIIRDYNNRPPLYFKTSKFLLFDLRNESYVIYTYLQITHFQHCKF
jgi:hypothetical protein